MPRAAATSAPAATPPARATNSRARATTPPPAPAAPPVEPPDVAVPSEPLAVLPGGVPVWCQHHEILSFAQVKARFHPSNPNEHPEAQITLLSEVIAQTGWRAPVVISLRSGLVTKGHGRSLSIEKLGKKLKAEVGIPVQYQNYPDEAAEIADMVADNRISELSHLDEKTVANLAASVSARFPGYTMSGFGYTSKEIKNLLAMNLSIQNGEDGSAYTRKVQAPTYTPKGDKPPITALYDDSKTQKLIAEIEKSNLPAEEKRFLTAAAYRHTVFDFEQIAEHYAHAEPPAQELMENSALVIIDFEKAIELGYIKLSDGIKDVYTEDKGDDEA